MNDRNRMRRLPQDEAYWDALAARAIAAALGSEFTEETTFRSGVAGTAPWWTLLANASHRLAAATVLALIGGALLLSDSPADRPDASAIRAALSPEEPLLRGLVTPSAGPPPASVLVTLMSVRERER